MPMYEYRCRRCGEDFEELVRTDTPDSEVECPECGVYEAGRKLSTFAAGASRAGGYRASSSSGNCGPSGFS